MNLLRPLPLAALGLGAAALAVPLLRPAGPASAPLPLAASVQTMEAKPGITFQNALGSVDRARHGARTPGGHPDAGEVERIHREAGRVAGQEALERDRTAGPLPSGTDRHTSSLMRGFAEADPVAAQKYWQELPPGEFRAALLPGLLAGLATSAPAAARDLFASLPPDEQTAQLPDFVAAVVESQGPAGLRDWFDGMDDDPADPTVKWRAFHPIVSELKKDPVQNAPFMSQEAARPHAASDVYVEFVSEWTAADPAAALDWAVSLEVAPGSVVRADTIGSVLANWSASDSGGVGDWLNAHPDSPHYDEIAAGYAVRLAGIDAAASATWTASIRDPAMRDSVGARLALMPVVTR